MEVGTKQNKGLRVNLIWNRILSIILVFCNTHVLADECSSRESTLVFSNGMFNSRKDARISKEALRKKFENSFVTYELAYNSNETIIEQLLQVYEQKMSSTSRFVWSKLSQMSDNESTRESTLEKLKKINAESYVKDSDLRNHIQLYKDFLQKNIAVVIVAHSQGNFYANKSFDFLNENLAKDLHDQIKIVSVANPDHRVAGNGGYVTLRSDGVIRMIPYALPFNTENENPGRLDHQFVKHYLEGKRSGAKLSSLIAESVNQESNDFALGGNYYDDGYLNRDLKLMTNWLKKFENQSDRKLALKECLAISLFLKVENYFGETCENRNFEMVKNVAENCLKNEWSNDAGITAYDCGLIGLTQGFTLDRSPSNEIQILGQHTECFWEHGKVSRRLTPQLLNEALDLIKSPRD